MFAQSLSESTDHPLPGDGCYPLILILVNLITGTFKAQSLSFANLLSFLIKSIRIVLHSHSEDELDK